MVGGPDRRMGICVDAGRDVHEHRSDTGGGSPLDLVERVEHDEACPASAAARSSSSLLLFPVDDDVPPGISARSATSSSPRVETSAPKPSSENSRRSATLGNALTLYARKAPGAAIL
jgi:hypothetical protein